MLGVLLQGIVQRLTVASTTSLVQDLIMVFSEMVQQHPSDVVDFLASTSIGDRSDLQIVMEIWCEYFDAFSGYALIESW